MWTASLRLPDDLAAELEPYRRRIGARSLNEAIVVAVGEAVRLSRRADRPTLSGEFGLGLGPADPQRVKEAGR